MSTASPFSRTRRSIPLVSVPNSRLPTPLFPSAFRMTRSCVLIFVVTLYHRTSGRLTTQPKPQSGKTIRRKRAGKPEPKSVLTQADFEAIRQAIRVDLDTLRAELHTQIDGLRTETRDRFGVIENQVGSLGTHVTELRTETRERAVLLYATILSCNRCCEQVAIGCENDEMAASPRTANIQDPRQICGRLLSDFGQNDYGTLQTLERMNCRAVNVGCAGSPLIGQAKITQRSKTP